MKKVMLFKIALLLVIASLAGCTDGSDPVSFTLIQTTDVHHRAIGTGASATYGAEDPADDNTMGGYARIATKIAEIRSEKTAEDIPTLLVDSGDFLMGTVYDLTLGEVPAAMAFMSLMEYDAITLGNHEFDYGPEALASFLNNAIGESETGFQIPVVASNMITSSAPEVTDDDGLEALIAAGNIKETHLICLPNGLKVGIIGLLGEDAENDAPLAAPVGFKNDLTDAEEVAFIQALVDDLKNTQGADIIIALSHSGITEANSEAPGGDDIALANAVTGIDIIASGHEHEKTDDYVTENGTHIICAGNYGSNLAQLDITYESGIGVTEVILTNHTIDSNTAMDSSINFMISLIDAGINAVLDANSIPPVNQVIAGTDSDNLGKPGLPAENGMGNLVSDSLRFMLGGAAEGVGIVANGVVRNGFDLGQGISFADIYSVLPLGMTIDQTQQDVPGYPLMLVYLSGEEIVNMCQFISYAIAAGDTAFIESLPQIAEAYAGTPTGDLALGLQQVLPLIDAEYFLNTSGVRFIHGGAENMYQVQAANVYTYGAADFTCSGAADVINTPSFYPVVIDLYALFIMQDPIFSGMLTQLGIPIVPKNSVGTAIDMTNILSARLDMDNDGTNGIQEVKEWQAFLSFITSGLSSSIPDSSYGAAALTDFISSSRINDLANMP